MDLLVVKCSTGFLVCSSCASLSSIWWPAMRIELLAFVMHYLVIVLANSMKVRDEDAMADGAGPAR